MSTDHQTPLMRRGLQPGLDRAIEESSGRAADAAERPTQRLADRTHCLPLVVGAQPRLALVTRESDPEHSVGIGVSTASLAMLFSSWAQQRRGKQLGSNAVVADGTQALLCTCLSAVLLAGLVLNSTLGWGWADPVAGLVIAGVAVREGLEVWRGEGCCAPAGATGDGAEDERGCEPGCTDACCTSENGGLS